MKLIEGDKEESVQAGKIETSLSKEKRDVCRQMVKVLNEYGITQRQKLFICELLALELEDQKAMLAFADAVKIARTILKEEIITEKAPKSKLIL